MSVMVMISSPLCCVDAPALVGVHAPSGLVSVTEHTEMNAKGLSFGSPVSTSFCWIPADPDLWTWPPNLIS